MLARIFLDHPGTVNETYLQHWLFATRFSLRLLVAGLAALVHAFIPSLFEKTASTIITELYHRTHNRGSNTE